MSDKNLILASSSPRRKKILSDMGLEFSVIPSCYEEKLSDLNFSYEKIETLAYNKAKTLLKDHPEIIGAVVLSADTVVVLDNKILGKPKGEKEAFFMLKELSNKTHSVVTSICVIDSETKEKQILSTTSKVTFNKLDDDMISFYINKFKPFDKAGSYGIQELPEGFVKEVEGSFENIVGLCSDSAKKVLKTCKVL